MAAQPTKRSSNRIILIIGILCAALAFGGVLFLLKQGGSTGPTRQVLVAKGDIDAGTLLTADLVRSANLPEDATPADALTDPGALTGRVAGIRIAANTPIVPALFEGTTSSRPNAGSAAASAASGGAHVAIDKGYVALAIPAAFGRDEFTAGDLVSVGYYIQPGDHIDILIDPGQGAAGARYSFQDVLVLRVGTGNNAPAAAASPSAAPAPASTSAVPTVYVVELPRAQAEALTSLLTKRGPQTVLKYVLRPQEEYGKPGSPNYEDSGSPSVPAKQDQTVSGDTLSHIFTR